MENICFLGALSAELDYLDKFLSKDLGKEKTIFFAKKNGIAVEVSEKRASYMDSEKFGSLIRHAVEKSADINYHLTMINLYENNVAVINTGVGLEKALFSAKLANEINNYKHFINIGCAGALDESLKIGDIVSADKTCLINEQTLNVKRLKYIEDENYELGGVLSCHEFADSSKKNVCNKFFKEAGVNIKAVDMELYALSQPLPKIISFKVISDELSHCNEIFMENFPKFISNYYNPAIEKIINLNKTIL